MSACSAYEGLRICVCRGYGINNTYYNDKYETGRGKVMCKKQIKKTQLFIVQLIAVLLNTSLFAIVWYKYYITEMWGNSFNRNGNLLVVALYMFIYIVMARIYGGLSLRISRITELIYSQCVAILISNCLIYIVIILLSRRMVNVIPLLLEMIISCLISAIWSYIANHLTNVIYKPSEILLVYDNMDAYKNGKEIISRLSWRFNLAGEMKITEIDDYKNNSCDNLKKFIDEFANVNADSVMLCGLASSQRNDIVKYCVEHDIKAFVRPNIGDFMISNAQVLQMANLPVMICERTTPGIGYEIIKRSMDIIISLLGIIITSPILIITAILIKAYDGGPVFYKQVRLTKNGKEFKILKFRSMKVDAEKDGVARLSSQGDSRITPIGKVIRACRIDELPQMINILQGNLSCVGPRPERPEISEQYIEQMPEFSLRLQVKAGLTGYAQVYGKYNTEPYDKLQMDLMYISKLGIATDIKIILATIKILFMPESTEGIAVGSTTAMGQRDVKEEIAATKEEE